ncbi:MAG: hypothetical protein HXY41_09200 [Chloroflexi bacterium]|nr:hypothetical protein [Chloroflexota bacterium]
MSQQQNAPGPARPSPFAPAAQRPGSGGPPRPANSPAPAPPAGQRLGGLPRFGASKTHWRIMPVMNCIVRFDLNGLGDPLHRLLGRPLDVKLADTEAAIKAIEAGGAHMNELEALVEAAWQEYQLRGAVLLYPWRKELPQVMVGRVTTGDDTDDEEYEDDKPAAPVLLRALDMRLVINVLARTRSNILLSRAPLGLESQYLNQSLLTDDPRLVVLARATGCIEEPLSK